jgi:hypothetical protein
VRIDLKLGGNDGPSVTLRGQVINQVDDPQAAVVALAATEREKVNYLNGFVRGGLLNLRARRRLPVRLKVTYGSLSGPAETYCKDIGEQGIFVVTDSPLPERSRVHMLITVPGGTPLSLAGLVTHTVIPADEDVPGMGVVFELDPSNAKLLLATVDRLEADLLAGKLPEDALL